MNAQALSRKERGRGWYTARAARFGDYGGERSREKCANGARWQGSGAGEEMSWLSELRWP